MGPIVAEVVPFAVGAAISPAVLTAVVLVLAGKVDPLRRAWLFCLGAVAFNLVFFAVALLLLRTLPMTGDATQSLGERALKIVIAVALAALGVRSLLPRQTGHEKHSSRMAQAMQTAGPRVFVGFGFIMMALDASSIVILIPGLHRVALALQAGADPASAIALALLVLLLGVMVPFVVPVLLVSLLGHRADGFLQALNRVTTAHSRQITAGICFLFAVYVAWGAFA